MKFESDLLRKSYKYNSQEALKAFNPKKKYSFKDLAKFYDRCDIPQSQPGFKEFWKAFIEAAPPYEGGKGLKAYRGTSVETVKKHGYGIIWTIDRKLAERFATLCCSFRYTILFGTIDRNPLVLHSFFQPEEIVYSRVNGRGEQEVFINRSDWSNFKFID